MIATVEVEFTNRERHPDRTFKLASHFCQVLVGDSDTEATLVAHDLVDALLPRDYMITRTTILDVDRI
jgi:hypothetical protein